MEVAHHCPRALPHSAGGCCAAPTLLKEPISSPSISPVSVDSPLTYEERSPRNTDGNTNQQIESSSDGDDDDEPSDIMTPSQCAPTQSTHHSLRHSLDQHNCEAALPLEDEEQQQQQKISFCEASLSSCRGDELQEQDSAAVPSLSSCTLDPNAREFTPLESARPSSAVILMQPVHGTYSGIGVSVCYQASVSAMEGPCNYELVDTSLRLGLYSCPSSLAVAPDSIRDDTAPTGVTAQPESSFIRGENVAYAGFAEDYMGAYEHHVDGTANLLPCSAAMGEFLPSLSVGSLGPVQGSPPLGHFNPPILSLPSPIPMSFMAAPGLPPPQSMPPYLPGHLPHPEYMPPQQTFTVYTHKHFHPYYGWKEHISRALVISGVPPSLDVSHLHQELEQWGHVRAFHADRLSQGILSVQFFDLRASRQALRDMQNQHLIRQHRFQQHLHAQNGMQFQGRVVLSGANEDSASVSRGLLCGTVVWAQYVASSSVPCPDGHNQGTLVLFNVDADLVLQELQKVFEKYGDVREVREAPTKRQHKFVEYYDTRDAEAAWAALNGQEVCGKCVKIEFSRQGGPMKKQNNVQPSWSCLDRAVNPLPHMQQMHGLSEMDLVASYGWQGPQGLYQQEWHAGGNIMPFPNKSATVLPNTVLGPDGTTSRCRGRYLKRERGGIVTHMQGAIAGPRRKQSGMARSPSKMYQVVVHEPACGADDAFAVFPASGRCGAIQKNLNLKGHPQFEYDEKEVISSRTTLMIKNIPNKYSQQMLLSLLDHHCIEYNSQIVDFSEPESAYDFVYLPIDFKNRCNLGYAFVNFTTGLATLKFYKAFHAQQWEAFNSRKVCDIKYARVQGRRALENHFCNSRFACDTMEFLPVAFVPPRNGLVCPLPIAAAGLMATKSGRSVHHTNMSMQALLSPPPLSCKLLSEGHQLGKFMPESKCLLENAASSGSDSESIIEDDKIQHDRKVDTTVA
ncbi:hypothetical protein GOP47_0020125 [Adiantum capillus-veneris]|uniref:RRM domain-containing protein n=1 Tax=Adiantum capillus-veneris TaxID=13818 RepID=A0A9D4UCU6_ADICA|nr:hypothetical protein GOP47_0020125 [Adiantum capillus-veneris]